MTSFTICVRLASQIKISPMNVQLNSAALFSAMFTGCGGLVISIIIVIITTAKVPQKANCAHHDHIVLATVLQSTLASSTDVYEQYIILCIIIYNYCNAHRY